MCGSGGVFHAVDERFANVMDDSRGRAWAQGQAGYAQVVQASRSEAMQPPWPRTATVTAVPVGALQRFGSLLRSVLYMRLPCPVVVDPIRDEIYY
jgi:hypothetical protein